MDRKVIWSYQAINDLESIAKYISKDSPFYAASLVEEILAAGRSLCRFSKRGRVVPEFSNSNIRELFVRGYRLIYSTEEINIAILGIIHGKRDFKKL